METNTETYVITDAVPIPEKTKAAPFPLRQMKVGDSFFFPDANSRGSIRNLACKLKQKVSIRPEGDGYRVWRVG